MSDESSAHASTTRLHRIAERVLNRPLFLHPTKAEVLLWVLGERIGVDGAAFAPGPQANRFVGKPKGRVTDWGVIEYYREANGVGIVPIIGSLVNRGAWVGEDSSGVTSYEGVAFQLAAAAADPDVKALVLDFESPGGEASGLFGLAAQLRALREQMPVIAVVNDMAASAAYGLASAADEIVVSPTSLTGSIGTLLIHFDYSKQMDNRGIKPTLIFAGAHKVDGHGYGPLPADVKDDLQREVSLYNERFLETVGLGRPGLGADGARKTEARIFIGAEAVSNGLADRVGTLADVISSLSASVARGRASFKGASMKLETAAPGADQTGTTISKPDHDAALAKAKADGLAEGEGKARAAAHDRVKAILADDKVKGKEAIALDLAMKSPDMKAEDVAAFVAGLPAGAAKTPTIAERMNGQGGALALGGPIAPGRPAAGAWAKITERTNRARGFKD